MRDPLENNFRLSRRIFCVALGVVYVMAFVSLAVQICGLVGPDGILPAADFFSLLRERGEGTSFWKLHSLFWWWRGSDAALLGVCWAGVGLALILILGWAPVPILTLLWFLYLSMFYAGQIFLGYQWDILLLEAGFLAIFLAPAGIRPDWAGGPPPSKPVLWLFRWLLFRLMFASALVKWMSGDPSWRDLSALQVHYETQPLPTWIAYYFHQLPAWFQKFSTLVMYFSEGVVPFFVFAPRRLRHFAAWWLVGFQVLILLTGNYGFFNYLSIALCLLLWDDAAWPPRLRNKFFAHPSSPQKQSPWVRGLSYAVCAGIFFLSLQETLYRWMPEKRPLWIERVASVFSPFHLVGHYGLFAVMTKDRLEIRVEGSEDGITWRAYEFRYKPGPLQRRPGFVAPHQPRLDWQMWFSALGIFQRQYWFHGFLASVLEGSAPVLKLLEENPFPSGPPRYVRARIADYSFTTLQEKRETKNWWKAGEERAYSPELGRE